MGEREWQKLLTLVGRGVQQQFQMSEFRVWKCDRTDSCQTKPLDTSLRSVNTPGQSPDCPAELSAISYFSPRPFEIWKETKCLVKVESAWLKAQFWILLTHSPNPHSRNNSSERWIIYVFYLKCHLPGTVPTKANFVSYVQLSTWWFSWRHSMASKLSKLPGRKYTL